MTVADNVGFGLKVRQAPEGRDRQAGRRAARADPPAGQGRPLSRASCRAASSSASRWPAPSRSSRRSCSSTSRCPRSTPRSGRPAQGDPGDPAPARHHDGLRDPRPGGGALAVRPGRGHERGPDRADRHPVRDLQLPGDAVRGLVRRHAQPARRRRSSTRRPGALSIDGQEVRTGEAGRRARERRDGDARPPAGEHRARRGRRARTA